jgi:hypothetical protein
MRLPACVCKGQLAANIKGSRKEAQPAAAAPLVESLEALVLAVNPAGTTEGGMLWAVDLVAVKAGAHPAATATSGVGDQQVLLHREILQVGAPLINLEWCKSSPS